MSCLFSGLITQPFKICSEELPYACFIKTRTKKHSMDNSTFPMQLQKRERVLGRYLPLNQLLKRSSKKKSFSKYGNPQIMVHPISLIHFTKLILEKMLKKWTFGKFFPQVCILVLKLDSHNAISHNAALSFPQKTRCARKPCISSQKYDDKKLKCIPQCAIG